MAKIIIKDVRLIEGEYEFDDSYFTNRDMHIFKTVAGLRVGELEDAMEQKDNDVTVALAVIALQRNGVRTPAAVIDLLWDAPLGSVTADLSDEEEAEEDDALPPAIEPSDESKQGSNETVSSDALSNGSGDLPETSLEATGTPV